MGRGAFTNLTAEEFIDRTSIAHIIGWVPSSIFYVDSANGSSSNDGLLRSSPMATIAQALAKCTDAKGDAICVLPGHAETLSATTQGIAFSKTGVALVGFGNARNRPAITCGAADIVGFLLSGSNCLVKNLRLIGSTSQTSAASYLLSVTGTDNVIENCVFEHGGAGPLRACGMAGASRTTWKNCTWLGTAAGPDRAISINTASVDSVFQNLLFQYISSSGLDSGCIVGSAGVAHTGYFVDNCVGIGMDTLFVDINGSHASISTGDGVMRNCVGTATAAVTIANFIDGGGMVLCGNWVADAVASPAITTGAVGAITTASQRVPAGSPVT